MIYALDLATTTGWAFWKPGMPKPRYGRWKLPAKEGDVIEYSTLALRRKIRDWDVVEPLAGADVLIEAGNIFGRDNQWHAMFLLGLTVEAGTTALELKARPLRLGHGEMMKIWVGHGNLPSDFGKQLSMISARMRGFDPKDNNAADALGHLNFYVHTHDVDVPWDKSAFKLKDVCAYGGINPETYR